MGSTDELEGMSENNTWRVTCSQVIHEACTTPHHKT